MGARNPRHIFLTGFSGSGKTQVGRIVSRLLRRAFVDTDTLVSERAGRSIPEIFASEGEAGFRQRERDALALVCAGPPSVVSTGGGLVTAPANRDLMRSCGVVVCLEAPPAVLAQRLERQQEQSPEVRPLLAGGDLERRVEELKRERQAAYADADWTVQTELLSPEESAAEVARAWEMLSLRLGVGVVAGDDLACEAITPSARYPVFVGWELLSSLGERLRARGASGRAFVISDSTVAPLYGKQLGEAVTGAGYEAVMLVVPAGEESKSLKLAGRVYDWLVERRAERGDFIVALGGGVVSDVAGFVAATFARGLAFVVCPTSLLAMVDASIGGKTGVNHPKGKNLIGAFHQPRLVLADAATLRTLPARELRSGLAEVAKHAFILDAGLIDFLEKRAEALLALEPDTTVQAVRRSAAIKCAVVSEDEREQGRRIVLNFGHTVGHALEAATEYKLLLHGEAVSLGMVAAARVSEALGLLSAEEANRVGALLSRFGLPVNLKQIDVERVLAATELDKKVRGQAVRWVLLEGFGRTVVRDDVPEDVVREALAALKS